MTSSFYDELGVDPKEGISPEEIQAAKLLLGKIKLLAADVAKREDTDDTLKILEIIHGHVKFIAAMRRPQAEAFDAMLRSGQVPQPQQAPASALGAGGGAPAPTTGVSQQVYDKLVADHTMTMRLLGDIMSDSRLGIADLRTAQDFADLRTNLRALFDKANSPATITQADLDRVTAERDDLKTKLAAKQTELDNANTGLTDLKAKLKTKLTTVVNVLTGARDSKTSRNEQVIAKAELAKASTALNEAGTLLN